MLGHMSRRREALGWIGLGVACALPVALWATAGGGTVSFASPAASMRTLAFPFAHAGFAAYALNIVLGARLGLVDRLFGGMDRVYRTHRRLGVIAVALLATHGILMAAALPAGTLGAGVRTLLLGLGWRVAAGVLALCLLLSGVLISVFVPVAHPTFVWVQRFMGGVFALGALHATLVPGAKATSPLLRGVILLLAAAAGAAYCYRVVFGAWAVRRYPYRVDEVRPLDGSTTEVVMVSEERPMRYEAGQFLIVTFRRGGLRPEPHPFSIASSPRQPDVRIVAKALGDYTAALPMLRTGATAEIEGPYGGFTALRHPNPRQVWVAGGIGITPFLSMARTIDGEPGHQVDLYYCTERAEEAHFLEELDEIADRTPGLRVIPVRKTWLGFLTAADIEGASRDLPHTEIFICGPPAMSRALDSQLRALGVPKHQIHFEDFSFV
jgi:predicted ferric reductase